MEQPEVSLARLPLVLTSPDLIRQYHHPMVRQPKAHSHPIRPCRHSGS